MQIIFTLLFMLSVMGLIACLARPSILALAGRDAPSRRDIAIAFGSLAFLLLAVAIGPASNKNAEINAPSPQTTASPSPALPDHAAHTQPPAREEVPIPTPEPSVSTHNYSMVEDGEYGYESALSNEERNRGVAVKPIQMIRYLGERDGTYSVQVSDGSARQVFSCKEPCDFIKMKAYFQGELVKTIVMKNAVGSVISAVMEDAIAGDLEPYSAKRQRATELSEH